MPNSPRRVRYSSPSSQSACYADTWYDLQLTPERQRITIPSASAAKDPKAKPTVLDVDVTTLATYGVPDSGAELRVKDLGPQVSWRTVFLLEYVSFRIGTCKELV